MFIACSKTENLGFLIEEKFFAYLAKSLHKIFCKSTVLCNFQLGAHLSKQIAFSRNFIMGLRNFQSMFKLTNKQTIYSFNDIQAPDLHTAQYYNIYKIEMLIMIIIKITKIIYMEDLLHHVEDVS